jgi:Zn-dependent M28 family amino/carboxypeptidase
LLAGALVFLLYGLTGYRWLLGLTLLPELLLLAGTVLFLHPDQTPFSPGAYDNASGVGSVLGLVERLRQESLGCTEVWAVFLGGEENGSEGSAAFLDQHALEGTNKFVINLDMMGRGKLYVRTGEGFLIRRKPAEPMLELARRAARALPELEVYERRSQAFSDATPAYKMGLKALSLGAGPKSPDEPLYRHTLSDTPEHIEPQALKDTHRFVWELLRLINQGGCNA